MEIITDQSSRKRQKPISGEDRLSALPDHIICHILSFLPTTHSVKTSVLAKRWTSMWAHVPSLHFNEENHNSETVSISNIISRVMLCHKVQRLKTFHLSIKKCNNYELETWISTLVDRNVQQLYVCLGRCQLVLPPRLFACKALVDLTLRNCGVIPTNGTTLCLPALKKLCLDCVMYESDESLPRLLSNCPVLEELTIDRDANELAINWDEDEDNMICCYISSPTLNRLSLTSRLFEENKAYKVKLDTPALRYLRVEDLVSEYHSVGALTSVTKAYLDLLATVTLASVLEFLSRLCNVEYLKLWTSEIELPDSESFVFTTKFHNLVKLELEGDWRLITKLLENADNLQDLVIDMTNTDLKGWMDPEQVPACLVSRLQSVTIKYSYSEDEVNLVRYILGNAKVLELMDFCGHRGPEWNEEMQKRVLLFERRSEACQVHFH